MNEKIHPENLSNLGIQNYSRNCLVFIRELKVLSGSRLFGKCVHSFLKFCPLLKMGYLHIFLMDLCLANKIARHKEENFVNGLCVKVSYRCKFPVTYNISNGTVTYKFGI